MPEIVALLCLPGALLVLYFLALIDFRSGLLPNEWVLGFAGLAFVFHFSTLFYYLSPIDMMLGAAVGGGFLYVIRAGANYFYKDDALGLGDVKLLAAAGLWLGPQAVLIALTIGAFAGLAHGVLLMAGMKMKTETSIDIGKLSLPAGPGFALGIIAAGIYKFQDFAEVFLS
jgi:leader peptidase (prepilin peptidase)/N-methyltransferase